MPCSLVTLRLRYFQQHVNVAKATGNGAEAEERRGAASIVSDRRRTERCENTGPPDRLAITHGDEIVMIKLSL